MTWFREHVLALAIATGAGLALAGSVIFFDVVPRMPEGFDTRVVAAGTPISMEGYELTQIELAARDSEGLLPDGVVLYAVEVSYAPNESYDESACIAVRLIEVDHERRAFEPFQDWDVGRAVGDFPANCISSYDGAAGTVKISFVLPDDHGSLALVLGGPFGDRVQVPVSD